MRELQNEDMYLLSEIADKIDLSFPKIQVFADNASIEEKTAAQKDYGMQIITMLIKKMHLAKNEINQLIGNVTGKSVDEVKKMSIKETISILKSLIKQDGVLDFFK